MSDFGIEKTIQMMIMRFSSSMENIDAAVMHTADFVASLNRTIDLFGLKLVLSEGITNATVHGNKERPDQKVDVKITLTADTISIRIKDDGAGFDWKCWMESHATGPEDASGRGLDLIRGYGYELSYNEAGNILRLVKRLDASAA